MLRTHTCGELRAEHAGERASVCGWVRNRRDHGGLLFLDVGDRYGLTQVVVEPEAEDAVRERAERVRLEWVVRATGTVRARPEGTRNPDRATGDVELVVDDFEVLNASEPVPIAIVGAERTAEELASKYRYLEIRRSELRDALLTRARILTVLRRHMIESGFTEVETPALLRSTPEGARDYLVPSRVQPGTFYSLLQSPQILKQLLMVGGLDRYWQVVRCFRDEDLRADRQPEFTQLDVELSFCDEEDVFELGEGLITRLAREIAGIEVERPFPRLSFEEAEDRYGTDKPDLRFELPVHDVSAVVADCEFGVFSGAVKAGGQVRAIAVPPGHQFSRKQLDGLPAVVRDRGAKGVAWCRIDDETWKGPAARFLSEDERTGLVEATGAAPGGILLFLAGPREVVVPASGDLRLHLGHALGLVREGELRPVWVTGFPLVVWNAEEERWDATHHPFTAPVSEDLPLLESEPGRVRSRAYDLALNGSEILGGSIRIHDRALQLRMLELLGMDEAEAEERFGFLLEALRYGAPPHGGFASGIDRLVMIFLGLTNIRDVIAFPKTLTGADPMTGAPARVDAGQLEELHIRLVEEPA